MLEAIDHGTAREIANGIWTLLGIFLIVALLSQISEDIRLRPGWYNDRGTALAVGMLVYFVGSIMRSAYIWAGLIANNRRWDDDVLAEWHGTILIAAGFAIVGAMCVIRVCLVDRFGTWSWITAGLVSVGVPLAVFYLVD